MESNDHFMESSLNCSLFKCELIKIFAPLATKYDHSLLSIFVCRYVLHIFPWVFIIIMLLVKIYCFPVQIEAFCHQYSGQKHHYTAEVQLGVSTGGREPSPRNLADQLTLFKPGGRLCPSHYCQPPPPDSKSYLHLCTVCVLYKMAPKRHLFLHLWNLDSNGNLLLKPDQMQLNAAHFKLFMVNFKINRIIANFGTNLICQF